MEAARAWSYEIVRIRTPLHKVCCVFELVVVAVQAGDDWDRLCSASTVDCGFGNLVQLATGTNLPRCRLDNADLAYFHANLVMTDERDLNIWG
ncbi:hypothetical protein TCAL_15344 [Tigriopus californicus]|uniref:Uncharacterized protein n=1 Tax=Tigriopus californicus TaxID=6832 RepID=A0A553PJ93_TIGCA|nr:hypothetical protein TCAL_15344 [Tigriopus californicus]